MSGEQDFSIPHLRFVIDHLPITASSRQNGKLLALKNEKWQMRNGKSNLKMVDNHEP